MACRHCIVVLALCHCRIRLGVVNGALLPWERESMLRRGEHRGGELVQASRRGGFASGTCAWVRGVAGSLHGAALGPGVPAFVLPEFGVSTETWVERRESMPCGGHVCRSGHV